MTPDLESDSYPPMIGKDAFCPKTGASLSRETHYDEDGQPRRVVQADDAALGTGTVGELTNGAVRSSRTALLSYFQRCHGRHAAGDDDLYRSASLALKRLKASADGRQEWDVHVWYALKRRLDRTGYDVEWMDGYAELWCPRCHSKLQYGSGSDDVLRAWCGIECTDRPVERLTELREIMATLYRTAFDEATLPASEDFLQA